MPAEPYYRDDLALVHARGFGHHADACAPGILDLLAPVRARGGVVLELGCGAGALTRHLVGAGHRVIATDASPAMLQLTAEAVEGTEDLRRLTLPHDPVPPVDAVVSTGHVLSYLPDEAAVHLALQALARALRPGGLLAVDVCDLRWGAARQVPSELARVTDAWALFTRHTLPAPDRFVREMTTFVRAGDGTWRRDDERHDNVLVDTSRLPAMLGSWGVAAEIHPAFGSEQLPEGLVVLLGRRSPATDLPAAPAGSERG